LIPDPTPSSPSEQHNIRHLAAVSLKADWHNRSQSKTILCCECNGKKSRFHYLVSSPTSRLSTDCYGSDLCQLPRSTSRTKSVGIAQTTSPLSPIHSHQPQLSTSYTPATGGNALSYSPAPAQVKLQDDTKSLAQEYIEQ